MKNNTNKNLTLSAMFMAIGFVLPYFEEHYFSSCHIREHSDLQY